MIFQVGPMMFQNAIGYLDQMGLRDVILPFILVFGVLFGILQRVKIFGSDPGSKKFNVIISLVIGLMVVVPHVMGAYPSGTDVVVIMNQLLPEIALLLLVLLMVMVMTGLLGGKDYKGSMFSGIVAIIALIGFAIILYTTFYQSGSLPYWLYFLDDPNFQSTILFLIIFGGLIAWLTGEPSADKSDAGAKMKKFFGWE